MLDFSGRKSDLKQKENASSRWCVSLWHGHSGGTIGRSDLMDRWQLLGAESPHWGALAPAPLQPPTHSVKANSPSGRQKDKPHRKLSPNFANTLPPVQ